MNPDKINFLFQMVGAGLVYLNVRRIIVDKVVHGVSLWPTAFWTLWGFWNLIFYSSLEQTWSFIGGLFLVMGNGIWLSLALYYHKNK